MTCTTHTDGPRLLRTCPSTLRTHPPPAFRAFGSGGKLVFLFSQIPDGLYIYLITDITRLHTCLYRPIIYFFSVLFDLKSVRAPLAQCPKLNLGSSRATRTEKAPQRRGVHLCAPLLKPFRCLKLSFPSHCFDLALLTVDIEASPP